MRRTMGKTSRGRNCEMMVVGDEEAIKVPRVQRTVSDSGKAVDWAGERWRDYCFHGPSKETQNTGQLVLVVVKGQERKHAV